MFNLEEMISFKIKKTIFSFLKRACFLSILCLMSCNLTTKDADKDSNIAKTLNASITARNIINSGNFSFPNGKLKSLIMSFDDSPEHDRLLLEKLNAAGIVGTFHLNSGRLGEKAAWLSSELGYDVHFVNESEIHTIYKGREISGHTLNHTGLNDKKDSIIKFEVSTNRDKLNQLIYNTNHHQVQGLAYPFGAYDENTLKTLEKLQIQYARTTKSAHHFELPFKSFLTLDPTCHISEGIDFANYFVYKEDDKMKLLHIWGHSYEFHESWKSADSICNILGNNKQIWYAQTIELVEYLNAIKELSYSENLVFNPSESISVWVKNEQGNYAELSPRKSMKIHFKSSYITVNTIEELYPNDSVSIRYHGSWTKVNYKQRIEEFKNDPLHFGDIVFVGNSITEQGGDWSKKLNIQNVRNRGIAGDVTDGVLKRIDEITYYEPKTVFLLIGINDLFNLHFQKEIPSTDYVANNIIKIAETIHKESPKTKVYVQTILPTSEDYMVEYIEKVNAKIRTHKNNSFYQLIDLHKEFVNHNGLMKPNLTSDGTHLNESGYKVWIEAIEKAKS